MNRSALRQLVRRFAGAGWLTFRPILVATSLAIAVTGCGSAHRATNSNAIQAGDADPSARSKLNQSQQADVYFNLGRSAEGQGNLSEAVRMYQSVIAKQPKAGEAHWRLAVCLDKSGNFDKSGDHYARAIEYLPGNPHIFADYGYSLSLQTRWKEAETQLRQAIALKPDLRRAHNNLGIVMAQGANLDEALRAFQLGGSNVLEAHWNVGQTLVAQSRWDEARGEFQHILTLNPGDPAATAELKGMDRMIARLESLKQPETGIKSDDETMRAAMQQASGARSSKR